MFELIPFVKKTDLNSDLILTGTKKASVKTKTLGIKCVAKIYWISFMNSALGL